MIDATVIAAAALLLAGAGVVFALSLWVGMLLGRRMDRALEARQDADGATPSDQAPDVGEEVGIDE
ncbi:MAG TPA: hypothetical protein VIK06_07805 [Candidatus Limnocylindrales bacterium]